MYLWRKIRKFVTVSGSEKWGETGRVGLKQSPEFLKNVLNKFQSVKKKFKIFAENKELIFVQKY